MLLFVATFGLPLPNAAQEGIALFSLSERATPPLVVAARYFLV